MDMPLYIGKDTYTGKHTTAVRKGMRVTTWAASELADLATEGVIFASFGHVHGQEKFARTRYLADDEGNLHCYDSCGGLGVVYRASRKLRILTT